MEPAVGDLRDADHVAEATEGVDAITPEQPRSVLTITPSSLVGWAATHLRPALWSTL